MDYLRDGISLRAYAQRDPLVEYQREGYAMFATMLDAVKEEAVGHLFHREVAEVEADPPAVEVPGLAPAPVRLAGTDTARRQPQQPLTYSAPTVDGPTGPTGVVVTESAPALGIGALPGGGSPGAQAANRRPAPGQAVGSGPARNAPCPCGSGKKYKRCHATSDRA
jgi:preprotein translocase subunit SecA